MRVHKISLRRLLPAIDCVAPHSEPKGGKKRTDKERVHRGRANAIEDKSIAYCLQQ
jgi:hypothetical protein